MTNIQKTAIISLITIPLVLIAMLFIFIFALNIEAEDPKYNFVYAYNDYYNNNIQFDNGKVVTEKEKCIAEGSSYFNSNSSAFSSSNSISQNNQDGSESTEFSTSDCDDVKESANYYIHDVENNISETISIEELNDTGFINSSRSPDGFKFETYYYQGSLLSISPNNSKEDVLVKDNTIIEQSIVKEDRQNFTFIGWIKN